MIRISILMSVMAGAIAQPPPEPPLEPAPGSNVINLGDKGLRDGDLIDPYIEQYFKDGNQVRVPAGTYLWNQTPIGPAENASFIGEGMVVLDTRDDLDKMFIINLTSGSAMEVRNVTVRGVAVGRGPIVLLNAQNPDARVVARNIRLSDGASYEIDNSRSGMFVNRVHEGEAWVIDCHIEGFADNGLYASAPIVSAGRNGAVHVRRGLFKNNNISGIRIGSSNSSIIGSVVINDALAPRYGPSGARNQRGIWVVHGRDNLWIEDAHVYHTIYHPVIISAHGSHSASGTIRNLYIHNDSPNRALTISGGDWTGGDIHLTGRDTRILGGMFDPVYRGAEAKAPDLEPRWPDLDPVRITAITPVRDIMVD